MVDPLRRMRLDEAVRLAKDAKHDWYIDFSAADWSAVKVTSVRPRMPVVEVVVREK